jgi:hypothetical protein
MFVRHRERYPRPMKVVAPWQVTGWDPSGGVQKRHHPFQRERFVTLEVQDRCQAPCQYRSTVRGGDGARQIGRSERNVSMRAASCQQLEQ